MTIPVKKVFVFLLIAISSATVPVRADDMAVSTPNELGLGLNVYMSNVQDETLLPLVWYGGIVDFYIDYVNDKGPNRHEIYLKFPMAGFFMDRYQNEAVFIGIHIGYNYLYRAARIKNFGIITAGFTFDGRMDMFYFGRWDDSHLYWMTTYSPGISVGLDFEPWNQVFSLVLSYFPVTAASRNDDYQTNKMDPLTRPLEYFSLVHQNMDFYTVPDFVYFKIRLTYKTDIKGTSLEPAYEFSYLRVAVPEPATILNHNFLLRWVKLW